MNLYASNTNLTNVIITENDCISESGNARGGGIYIYGNSSLIANDLIIDNNT